MAAQMRELKSILKPPRSSHTPQQKSQAEAEKIALAHARIIQQQKDLELRILDAIETLSTYPPTRSPSHTASSPSPQDASSFKSLIRPFQPSDYDDLIEERNILGHCGYALCPKPRRSDLTGKFTLVNHNRPDFAIVETKDVQRWCSDGCARRALYVKVQLSETAAWERVAMPDVRIDLLDEEPEQGAKDTDLARDIAQLKLDEERRAKKDSTALSLERGDVLERGEAGKARKVPLAPKFDLTIREKDVKSVASPPQQETSDQDGKSHLVLEGHRTRFGAVAEESDSDEETEA
ncbi:DUF408 domain protein [Coniochaeta ligniaria NRRL 30616]|uniref:RNA polymerase II subunit B1 CTD phosphatase RPAP2 homolog n=1 Tax=Coniochaeta ligniaria NRRL 30616 TaxID=1408157 RepID=A0A1J7IM64_9PEZI|nr:DUF408 domain protein [Coniochaeta ligniaria NRRL 30616]